MRQLAVLATTALLALAGCGGGDDKDKGGGDPAAVRSTMTDYFAALASGDGGKVCGFFTDAATKRIEAAGAKCADAVSAGVKGTGTEPYKNPEIGDPKVTGDSATVHYALTVKGRKVEADQQLSKVGGDWKLEAATPPGG